MADRIAGNKGVLWVLLAAITALIVWYSQTAAFAWDEGFHIVTASAILHGKRPYLDFCFSQTPLNAYWNALWMAILGETWRVAHLMAGLGAAAGAALASLFVLRRFHDEPWRLGGAVLVAVFTGLNVLVVRYGTISQAYGLGVLLVTAGYWMAVKSLESPSLLPPFLAGFFSGAAAGSTLLTAPVAPVLFLWQLRHDRGAARWLKLAAFVAGGVVACAPILWLGVQGPQQVWFGIVDYNLLYRLVDWPPPDANRQNFEVITSWIDSGPTLILFGLAFLGFRSTQKLELRLCGWLTAAIGLYTSVAVRPTFPQYFVFAVPFLSILAVQGLRSAFSGWELQPRRRWLAVGIPAFLAVFGLAHQLYLERDDASMADFEEIARKVDEVTPKGAKIYADEIIYFLTKRQPPPGMEEWNSHKLEFPPAKQALFHVIPTSELDRQTREGQFATSETCKDEDFITERGYAQYYEHRADVEGCTIFWGYSSKH